MGFKLIIKPVVWSDVDEAIGWYEKESPGLGKRFIKNFEEAKIKITKQPLSYGNVTTTVKRILLKSLPYKKIYYFLQILFLLLG